MLDIMLVKSRDMLIRLLEISTLLDKSFDNNLYKEEQDILNSLTIRELEFFLDTLNRIYDKENNNILEDIKDVNTKINYEHLKFNIKRRLYTNIMALTIDYNSRSLFEAIKSQEIVLENINEKVKINFINLLSKHLNASKYMSNDYQEYIQKVLNRINFKYKINFNKKAKININNDDLKYLESSILDDLIINTIKELSSFKDEELENDVEYAKGMCYHMLLRSLFIVLNDYELLAKYNETFNNYMKKETISKGIIRSAFISNYKDLNELKRGK